MAYTINAQTIRRHLVDWKYAALALLTGLSQGAAFLGLYWALSESFASSFSTTVSIAICSFLFWAIGAWWWGRSVDGESSIAPQMFALMLFLASLYWCFWPWLIALSQQADQFIYQYTTRQSMSGITTMTANSVPALAVLMGPGSFFCGGSLPLLAEASLRQKGMYKLNLPIISGLWGLGLLLAAVVNRLVAENSYLLWGGLALMLIGAICAFVMAKKEKSHSSQLSFSIFPTRSLGLWKDESMNVLDHDLSKATARFIWLTTFLMGLSCSGLIFFWSQAEGLFFVLFSQYQLLNAWILICASILCGVLLFASQVVKIASLPGVLALMGLLTTAALSLAPKIVNIYGVFEASHTAIIFLMLIIALLACFWLLAIQLFQAHRGWLASSFGLATFWLLIGIIIGIIINLYPFFPLKRTGFALNCCAVIVAVLSFSPLVGRFLSFIGWLLAIIFCVFWLWPQYSRDFIFIM